MAQENEFLWNQFCRLGEMMGDGLHHEPDGAWITKEYRKLSKILMPDMRKEMRERKSASIDEQMKGLIEKNNCVCGGALKQARKGSKVAYCTTCNKRYKAGKKKG